MISVIIPNYNHAVYLKQRIESVLNQTFQDFELIILDDCSTDNSRQIIEQYRNHPKIVHIEFNEKNSGSTFKQWKKGLDIAQGTWIWIAESDDYCDLNFLECLMEPAISSDNGLRYVLSRPVDAESNLIEQQLYHPEQGSHKGSDFFKMHLLELNRIPNASGVVVKADLLAAALTKNLEQYRLLSDWIIWSAIVLHSDVYYTEKSNNFHRYHSLNVRSKLFNEFQYYQEFQAFRKLMKEMIEASKLSNKDDLLELNKRYGYKENGHRGVELWRKGDYFKSIPFILKASVRPSLNIYFIKSLFYWMKEDKKKTISQS